ncbi:MAG: hypothetical protein ABIE68_00370 [bacterium]
MTKKQQKLPIVWLALVFVVFVILGTLFGMYTNTYRIVYAKDLSYKSCKRIIVEATVKDNTTEQKIEEAANKIITQNKNQDWEDITVWIYKKSDFDYIGNTSKAVFEKQESVCN